MSTPVNVECEAVVFDLDGVLVDSGEAVIAAWEALAQEFGFDLTAIRESLHGVRTVDALPARLAASGAVHRLEEIEIEMAATSPAVAGAADLIAGLPKKRWAIATSGSRALATARLEAVGLPIPAVMVTADDVAAGKPDPAPYVQAAAGLGVAAADTLVFEDAPSGATAARRAGAKVVGVATTHERGAFPAVAWVGDLRAVAIEMADPLVLAVG